MWWSICVEDPTLQIISYPYVPYVMTLFIAEAKSDKSLKSRAK